MCVCDVFDVKYFFRPALFFKFVELIMRLISSSEHAPTTIFDALDDNRKPPPNSQEGSNILVEEQVLVTRHSDYNFISHLILFNLLVQITFYMFVLPHLIFILMKF